jgi:tetratricopeptide (TPR) repeat protein
MGKVESYIKFAKIVLDPDKSFDDLDCAGDGMREILTTLDPENVEAAALLKQIIAEIDRRYDAGDDSSILCHRFSDWECPSPYVRARERGAVLSQEKVLDWYRTVAEHYPQDTKAWVFFGDACYDLDHLNDAIDAYLQALRIDPKYVNAWYNLGITYYRSGNRAAALDVVQSLRTLDPGRADKLFNLIVPR